MLAPSRSSAFPSVRAQRLAPAEAGSEHGGVTSGPGPDGSGERGRERVAEPDVAVRVVVAREAVPAAAVRERWVDERDVRQRARLAVGQEILGAPEPRGGTAAVERPERLVGEVVAGAEAV